jgi:hypothetical protein
VANRIHDVAADDLDLRDHWSGMVEGAGVVVSTLLSVLMADG